MVGDVGHHAVGDLGHRAVGDLGQTVSRRQSVGDSQ